MDKYKNKYRIPSTRLKNWDYGSNAAYFITICTQDRQHFFGTIANAEMRLNEIGQLAEKYWMEIPIHFPFIELGNFVIMPNHVHGILIMNKMDAMLSVDTLHCNVSTGNTPNNKNEQMAYISPKSGTISTIIRSYKSVVSKNARIIHADFGWQSRFYDHIIRNKQSFENIQKYISNNPLHWEKERFH